METLKALILTSEVKGTGSKLFAIIEIDIEDSEDTSIKLWRANDEEHLYEQFKLEYASNIIDEEQFNNDWGIFFLPKYLGEIE